MDAGTVAQRVRSEGCVLSVTKKNAAVRYLIGAGNEEGTFSIDGDTGDVIVAAELDYERRTLYELQLVAVSGKESSRAELLVTVLDANDEPPVFQQAVYRAELQEEEDPAHLPRTILTVRAVDGDVGRPQDIVYSISGPGVAPEGSGDDDFFRVDPNTGEIFVLKPLDRDPPAGRPLWRFTAFAQDEGGAGLVGFADVQVTLSDVNDNSPFFPQPLYHGYVVENAPAGTFILNVTAVDNDDPYEGSNAKLRYSIEKNAVDERTGSPMFEIDPDTGEIMTVVCCLDRERTPRFTIQVVAIDGGGQEGTTTVSITVKDVNDTPPEFSKLEWFVEVDETDGDNIPRKPILTVTVRDQDESNTFQFKVVENSGYGSNKFSLVRNNDGTASLKVIRPLDYEDTHGNIMRFQIQVTDKGDNDTSQQYYTRYAWVTVKLRDINDNMPVFEKLHAEVTLPEDVAAGKIVEIFNAKDPDGDGKSKVSYSISYDLDALQHFYINQDGKILIKKELDREVTPWHKVNILAVDDGIPAKTSTATLLVIVEDVNDNPPHLLENYNPVLYEHTPPTEIIEILGADADDYSRNNGPPFTFRMAPNADDKIRQSFSVTFDQKGPNGHGSAVISSLRSFDREEQKEYFVPILVTDAGHPQLSGTATVRIVIGDINDNKMGPGNKNVLVYKYQDQTPETDIGRIYVEDPDDWDLRDKTFYWRTYEHHRFKIDEDTGMITMKHNTPDGIYKLDFRVCDHIHLQNNVTASVTVTIKTIPYDRVINSASVRFHGISDEDFVRELNETDNRVERFRSYVAEILNTGKKNVDIFSVKQHSWQPPVLDIFFSVAASRHQRHETVNGLLQIHKEEVKRRTGLDMSMAGINYCFIERVQCQESCTDSLRVINQPHLVDANFTSLVGLTIIVTPECRSRIKKFASETCAEYHCYNGGHCLQKGTNLRCVCPVGFKGPRCQQTVRSFQTGGWAWFSSLHPQAENHLSLEFITHKEDGVLLYNGPLSFATSNNVSDYIALEIRQGEPRLLIHIDDNTIELILKVTNYVNDGKWHQVDIYWNHKNIRLLLDHCKSADVLEVKEISVPFFNRTSCMAEKELPPFSRQLLLNSPLQIGGIYWKLLPTEMRMWNASPTPANFDGCLSNLFYNGQILDLSDSLLSKNTAVGCQHTESSCRTLNCSGHGTCQADLTDTPPWCWCDAGWSGPNCSEPTQPVTFLPHSYIKFALSFETDRFMTLVQLRFRTEEPEGELFRLSDQYTNEYAVLEIKQRNVYFKYNLNSKNIEERYTCLCYVTVDDGNWHTVKVSRYGSLSTLQLDDGEFTRYNQTSVFEGHQWLVIDKQEGIHAGGKAEYTGMDTLEIYADFKNGCVDDVRLDGRALPLPPASNVTQWGQVTMALNLEHGCGFSSGCNFIICTEPVKCSDKLKQTNCMCSDEKVLATKSKDCATETCERKSCIGSDECLYQNTKFHYNCQCPDGETGMNCKFLGDKSAFSLTAWSLTALLLISVLILVLATSLISYKYFFSIHRRTEVKDDIQENVMNYADKAGSGNGGTSGIKPEKTSINETEASVSMELHDLKGSSGPDTKYLMEHKNKIDTDLLSENRDELNVYIYEGGGTAASSFSSLCAGFQEKEPDTVNFAQRGSFCILLEKQCQTEL